MRTSTAGMTLVWLISITLAAGDTKGVDATRSTPSSARSMNARLGSAPDHDEPRQQPQLPDQAVKNIQVLKGIPVNECVGTRGIMCASLSVCCGACPTRAVTYN